MRRERLLAAATRLFAERGYAATSMRNVAARARCNVALAYHHFGSKQALYEELIGGYSARFASLFAGIAGSGPIEERAGRIIHRIVDFMAENLPFVKMMFREVVAPSPVYVRTVQRHLRTLLAVAAGILERGAAQGVVEPVRARELLILGYGMVSYYLSAHASLRSLFGEDPLSAAALERVRGEVRELVFRRLGLSSPRAP